MKYLLLFALLGTVWFLIAKRRPVSSERNSPAANAEEKMLTCAFCSVHFPESDGVIGADAQAYCCEEHRQRAQGNGAQ